MLLIGTNAHHMGEQMLCIGTEDFHIGTNAPHIGADICSE